MLLAVFGCWALSRGLIEIASAIALRKVIDGEWMLVASGVVSVGFGLLVFGHPPDSLLVVEAFLGIYLLTFGAVGAGFRYGSTIESGTQWIALAVPSAKCQVRSEVKK